MMQSPSRVEGLLAQITSLSQSNVPSALLNNPRIQNSWYGRPGTSARLAGGPHGWKIEGVVGSQPGAGGCDAEMARQCVRIGSGHVGDGQIMGTCNASVRLWELFVTWFVT